jgi:AcrR family transcriptional regulator
MAEEKTSTRAKIMGAGRELFWKHGFKRVSIDDICKQAAISKMTFYRYFPNKIELAKSVYDHVLKEGYEKFQAIMKEDSSPEEKIRQLILLKLDGTNQISQEFLTDFYSSKELGLKDFVQERVSELWQAIIGDIREAQQKGIFRKDFNPELFFHTFQKLTELLEDANVRKLYNNTQDMIMGLISLLIYGIAPHK